MNPPGTSALVIPIADAGERAVLGAVLADGACFRRVAPMLTAGDFYTEAHRAIFEAFTRLAAENHDIDLLTTTDQLERSGTLQAAGGNAYVGSLADGLPDPANVEHYAKIVRDKAISREVFHAAREVEVAASDGRDLAALAPTIEALAATVAKARVASDAQMFERAVEAECLMMPPPRRRWLLTLPESQGGQGLLPRGKAGIIAAEGGIGKTAALVELAICVVTGRPWFGFYAVPVTVAGRVLLLLAEEDGDDAHRRLWTTAEALGLSDLERAECAERLVVIPLAGTPVALTATSSTGLNETPLAKVLRERLVLEAGQDGWAMVGLDPLSRFAGGDVEASNEAATRYIQVLESLAAVPGHPTVLVSAHSSKVARRQGQADVRGVTGLSDAARWVATLRREGEEVIFSMKKSNYSLPCAPLRLRWHDGVLGAVSGAEILAAASAAQADFDVALDGDVRRVVEVLVREGTMTSRDGIAHAAGLRLARGRAALDLAIARGLVMPSGTVRRPKYIVAGGGVCSAPPYNPRTAGTGWTGLEPSPSGQQGTGTGRAGTGGRARADPDPNSTPTYPDVPRRDTSDSQPEPELPPEDEV